MYVNLKDGIFFLKSKIYLITNKIIFELKCELYSNYLISDYVVQKQSFHSNIHRRRTSFKRPSVLGWRARCQQHQQTILGKFKVVYPKYSKHWLSTVAHTIDCVCSKILNHGVNHGLLFSLFKFFWWKNILN